MFSFFRPSSESSHHKNDGPSARGGSAFGGLPPQGLLNKVIETNSRHPREGGDPSFSVSLSETFLNISSSDRARDSLPKQHRAHFDELRSDILAFCHEFEIPVETLRSKEDFGKQLASKRIPPERMAQAVSLFERLDYLVTHKKLFREKLPEYLQETERRYNLTEQYDTQVSLLERIGVLKDGAIIGIDGKEYPIPTLEQITSRLLEREGELRFKRDQGFTKLLLVPFGMSLDDLCKILKQFLLSRKKFESPDINEDYEGADMGNPPKIVYNPKPFGSHYEGQTKLQILEAQADSLDPFSFPGWRIHLFQPSNPEDLHSSGFASIPRQGQGRLYGKETPRPDIEAGKTHDQYLSALERAQKNSSVMHYYHGESGLTPEDWILAFMTHFEETHTYLDDTLNPKNSESSCFLTGALFFPSIFEASLYAFWYRVDPRVVLTWSTPSSMEGQVGEHTGMRSSVVI